MDLGAINESIDIVELYSPERVTQEAKKFKLKPGLALDLKTGWDFDRHEHRQAAKKYIKMIKPKLVVGSPMCTMFSTLQDLTPWTKEKQAKLKNAKEHMEFTVEVYRLQLGQGGHVLHEHPIGATSWNMQCIKELANEKYMHETVTDQCMFGLETRGEQRGTKEPARKRTRFLTSSAEIARSLDRRCDGSHRHQPLVSGRATAAAQYPKGLCQAICRGLVKQLEMDRKNMKTLLKLKANDIVHEQMPQEEKDHEEATAQAWDDVSGKELDAKEVQRARLKEMAYVQGKKVWDKIDRQEALRNGWPVVATRWIDINKGDEQQPNYRSRLVAKEYANSEADGIFAATPPLETLRVLISEAATVEKSKGEKVIMIADISRAFFEADAVRDICVELPKEAKDHKDEGKDVIGKLRLSMYGTRDAAANFQRVVREFMVKRGWVSSRYCACSFRHPARDLVAMVHGDDFVVVGGRTDVAWFKEELQKRFEIKVTIAGSKGIMNRQQDKNKTWADLQEDEEQQDQVEVDEARILNRVVRVTEAGWEYEADQRHADLLITGMGMQDANSTRSPGEDEREDHTELEAELSTQMAKDFRGLAARANYLAQDRPDIQYAAKEVCRGMANPLRRHVKALRRIARYLIGAPRLVWQFRWQGQEDVQIHTDANWAGCRRTARSTSGGSVLRGCHCLRTWASTQKRVTLSSAESELAAATKASIEGIGMAQLMEGFGRTVNVEILVDSSAALAIVGRRGNGKLRHVRVSELWIQEVASDGDLKYKKVAGTENPADMMTKHVPSSRAAKLLELLNMKIEDGRARIGLSA